MSLRGRLHPLAHTIFMACRAVRQISPECAMPHRGHPNFEDCRPRNSGMRVAFYYRSAEAEPFRRGGTRCAFRRNPSTPSMAVFLSECACSRLGRGHAMPLRRQARDVAKITRFVRAFAENRANRSDFHETCLKLLLSSGRGGTACVSLHGADGGFSLRARAGEKNTPRPLAGPGVACSTARETAGLRCVAPPRG